MESKIDDKNLHLIQYVTLSLNLKEYSKKKAYKIFNFIIILITEQNNFNLLGWLHFV